MNFNIRARELFSYPQNNNNLNFDLFFELTILQLRSYRQQT